MAKTIDTKEIIKKALTKSEFRYAQAHGMKMFAGEPYYNGRFKGETKHDKEYANRECEKRVKAIRKALPSADVIAEWIQADNERIKFKKRMEREDAAINAQMKESGLHSVWSVIHTYKTGENTGTYTARYSNVNGIKCDERSEQYARSCTFPKIVRSFTLYVRKGWNVCKVGGLITFYKGEFDRTGMACEWIEQGKAISDLRTVKGFLVRGEHIEAKNLKEAKAINANHRAMQMARLLNARKRQERRQQQKANGTLMITFADSIASGNCRPGTQQFKQQYEEAIGHEAKSISIADLRKYGKMFGVEYYAEKAIEYALNH